jgi:YhcH/YjgK/YiaL family protein
MIIDSISGAEKYFSLNPHFAKAFDFLQKNNLSVLNEGKYEVDGTNVYATCMVRQGLAQDVAKFEAHNRYIDIQVCVSGAETFGWSHRASCHTVKGAYDPDKDIVFYADQPSTYVSIAPGQMAIFFPDDVHAPLVGSGEIKKVVVKVAV